MPSRPLAAPPAPGAASPDVERNVRRVPALDGIRAVAIALVLLFHGGFSWAGGGFIGVDVFFVLSGFLITGLLVAEFRQHSGIRLSRFWGHRVRRLLPALLAMLLGVAAWAAFLAPPDVLDQVRRDAVATLLYGNNWNQISSGQGYFAALNTPRPLVHTWSLSIEEQFYLVWPLVVLAVLRWTRSRPVLFAVSVAGAAASALEMAWLYGSGAGATRAYYGTDTRAQALLIGAALAVAVARPLVREGGATGGATVLSRDVAASRRARVLGTVVGGAGLGGVVAMAVLTGSGTAWLYRGGFALVALAAAALIASVTLVPATPWAWLLSLRPVRYVGAISYGLYLWHWPIFVALDGQRTGLTGWSLFAVRVAASTGVAAVSYHLLELPIRRGALRRWRGWVGAPVAAAVTAAVLVVATAGAVPSEAGVLGATAGPRPKAQDPGTSAIVPSVPAGTGGPIRVLLVGDSEASFLGFGLGPLSARYGVYYAGDGVLGCGLLQGETTLHGTIDWGTVGTRAGNVEVPCDTQYVRWTADLEAFHPDVVLLADGEYEVRNRFIDGHWTHIGRPGFDARESAAMAQAIRVLRQTGATVVLLTAPYYQQPSQPDGQPWPEDDPARVNTYNRLLRQAAAAAGPGVVVENLNAHLDPAGHYTQYLDGVDARYADGIHVSAAGAKVVAPWVLTVAHQLGVAHRAAAGIPGP